MSKPQKYVVEHYDEIVILELDEIQDHLDNNDLSAQDVEVHKLGDKMTMTQRVEIKEVKSIEIS